VFCLPLPIQCKRSTVSAAAVISIALIDLRKMNSTTQSATSTIQALQLCKCVRDDVQRLYCLKNVRNSIPKSSIFRDARKYLLQDTGQFFLLAIFGNPLQVPRGSYACCVE
jgi:hypothetical protein